MGSRYRRCHQHTELGHLPDRSPAPGNHIFTGHHPDTGVKDKATLERGFAPKVILRSEATKNLATGKGNETLRYAQGDI